MPGPEAAVQSLRMTHRGPAEGATASAWRRVVRRWLDEHVDIDKERSFDVVLAVYEALANCVDHAYVHGRGVGAMVLEVEYDPAELAVKMCVTDEGRWIDPGGAGRDLTRGRGLILMRSLADVCNIDGRDDGTTVCLHFHDCPARGMATRFRAG